MVLFRLSVWDVFVVIIGPKVKLRHDFLGRLLVLVVLVDLRAKEAISLLLLILASLKLETVGGLALVTWRWDGGVKDGGGAHVALLLHMCGRRFHVAMVRLHSRKTYVAALRLLVLVRRLLELALIFNSLHAFLPIIRHMDQGSARCMGCGGRWCAPYDRSFAVSECTAWLIVVIYQVERNFSDAVLHFERLLHEERLAAPQARILCFLFVELESWQDFLLVSMHLHILPFFPNRLMASFVLLFCVYCIFYELKIQWLSAQAIVSEVLLGSTEGESLQIAELLLAFPGCACDHFSRDVQVSR